LINFQFQYKDNLIEISNIFEKCYELDNNEIPARYRLKYLDRLFPGLNQKVYIFICFNLNLFMIIQNENFYKRILILINCGIN
jgi:hypothetical protein